MVSASLRGHIEQIRCDALEPAPVANKNRVFNHCRSFSGRQNDLNRLHRFGDVTPTLCSKRDKTVSLARRCPVFGRTETGPGTPIPATPLQGGWRSSDIEHHSGVIADGSS